MNYWLKFLLPGYYYFYSRLPRRSEQVSWLIVFPIVVLIAILLVTDQNPFTITVTYLIANFCWLNFYEIGYLENDAITIKGEKEPTLRIPESEILFIQENFYKLTIFRILTGVGLLIVLFYIIETAANFWFFILVLVLARFFFYLHNSNRSRLNVLTYHFLSTTKFFVFPILLVTDSDELIALLVALYLSFPLPRTIEHAVKAKYKLVLLKKLVGELDVFRLRYYLFLAILSVILYIFVKTTFSFIMLFLGLYFFVYRSIGYLLIKFGTYRRTKFKAHDWTGRS